MKIKDAMNQMRSEGYSEDDIFAAISKDPEALAQFHREDDEERTDKLMSRKLSGGGEDLVGQAKALAAKAEPSMWDIMKSGANGAADVVGAGTNALTMGLSNRLDEAIAPGSTRGQAQMHPFVRGTAEAIGGMYNPVNRMAGAIGGVATRALTSGLPTAQGFGQAVTRFGGNVLGRAAGGAVAGGTAQAAQEGLDGYQPGAGRRIVESAGIGGALAGVGSVLSQAANKVQNTRGARARNYASLGVEEAKRILADPKATAKDKEWAKFVVDSPQGGEAARAGMDVENDRRFGAEVDQAYSDARAQAKGKPVNVTGFVNELSPTPTDEFHGIAGEKQKIADLMLKRGMRLEGDQWVMDADAFNEVKRSISDKYKAYGGVAGEERNRLDQMRPIDAQARRLDQENFGEANAAKTRQEMAREHARKKMGLTSEPTEGKVESDAAQLERLMQPSLAGRPIYWPYHNAQALSGAGPVQGAARVLSALGGQAQQPQVQAQAGPAIVHQMQAAHQRASAIMDAIFGKKKEPQQGGADGVRQ